MWRGVFLIALTVTCIELGQSPSRFSRGFPPLKTTVSQPRLRTSAPSPFHPPSEQSLRPYASRQRVLSKWHRWCVRSGLSLYAAAFALLVLGGSRELLKLRQKTLRLGLVFLIVFVFVQNVAPRWSGLWLMQAVFALILVHVAEASYVRFQRAGPRIAYLIVTIVLLGLLGQIAASWVHLAAGITTS